MAGAALGAFGGGMAAGRPARAAAGGSVRLVQYPQAGFGGVREQIAHARRTIDMEMYELADPATEHALVAAAARRVRVRVLLDKAFNGGEVNADAFTYLSHHGVSVRWAPAGYIFHIKATSFDGRTTDVSTANLTSRYYATTRDAELLDTVPAQVSAIEATFDHDWMAGSGGDPATQTVQGPGLVWSPDTGAGTAETALSRQIRAARRSVDFESEELSDPAVVSALAADGRRGVDCRVVMTRSSAWDGSFAAITRAGCRVHVFPNSDTALYIHEKLILDDAGRPGESMFLGSQNASVTSLTRNRELGAIVGRGHGGARVIGQAAVTFADDFRTATPWRGSVSAPTPAPRPDGCHPRSSAGHCYEAGEYCSDAEHGQHGVAGDGEAIVCREENGGWRWEAMR